MSASDGHGSGSAPKDTPEAHADQVHTFPCQACGSSLRFEAGADALVCTHCATVQSIEGPERPVELHDFSSARRRAANMTPQELLSAGVMVACDACGAHTVMEHQADRCPFCDTPVVLDGTNDPILTPHGVLPFSVDRRSAEATFRTWASSRWFAPNGFGAVARIVQIHGAYLPYWSYHARTETIYTGLRGKNVRVESTLR